MPRTKDKPVVNKSDRIREFLAQNPPPSGLTRAAIGRWIVKEIKAKEGVVVSEHITEYVLNRMAQKAKERTAKARAARLAKVNERKMAIPVARVQAPGLPDVKLVKGELTEVNLFAQSHGGIQRSMELLDLLGTVQK